MTALTAGGNQGPTLRPYQLAAIAAVNDNLARWPSTLVVAATGTGKTVTFAELTRGWQSHGERTLILVHRDELVRQAKAKCEAVGLWPDVEKGSQRANLLAKVVIASVQTLRGARLKRWARDRFSKILVDEAHHGAAKSYRDVFTHFDGAKVIGFTATPDRADGQALGDVFASVAYRYEIRQAIAEGFLVPITARRIIVDSIDLSAVGSRAGDFAQDQLAAVMADEKALRGVVVPLLDLARDRRTIAFCVDVKHARDLAAMLNRYRPNCARSVSGETDEDERKELLEGHTRGDFQFLTNCDVLVEGYDSPVVSCIAMCRPTKSRGRFVQCLDDKTEVLTPNGWKGIDDDIASAAAFDPATGGVHWSSADKVERLLGDEAMYGISNPHLDIRVTAGHRMVVATRRKQGGIRALGAWKFEKAEDAPAEFAIPLAGKVHRPDEAQIADHDLTFLGLMLSDGHRNRSTNSIALTQSEKYLEVVERIKATLAACGFRSGHRLHTEPTNFGPRSPLHEWSISRGRPRALADRHLTGWERLTPWISDDGKSLTPAYELLSARQVRVLLDALQLGDGTKYMPPDHERATLSLTLQTKLADQLQSLFVRRGMRCNVTKRSEAASQLHVSSESAWHVSRTANDGRQTWDKLPSSPTERVWCVTVDTGAIITRRNGKVAVVGNCAGRGLRPFAGKTDCLILDFSGTAGKHRLVGPVDCLIGMGEPALDEDLHAEIERLLGVAQLSLDAVVKQAEDEITRRRASMQLAAVVRYRSEHIDPFVGDGRDTTVPPYDPRWHGEPASERQRKALEDEGVTLTKLPTGFSRADAWKLLAQLMRRRPNGLCSYKAAKKLTQAGVVDTRNLSAERAKELLDKLRLGEWRPSAIAREPEVRRAAAEVFA